MDGDIDAKRVWRAIDLSEEKYCSVSDSLKAEITHDIILNGVKLSREAQ